MEKIWILMVVGGMAGIVLVLLISAIQGPSNNFPDQSFVVRVYPEYYPYQGSGLGGCLIIFILLMALFVLIVYELIGG
jgi:hypothetical protein